MTVQIHFDANPSPTRVERGHLPFDGVNPSGLCMEVNSCYLEKGGQPWLPVMGEFQYSRCCRDDWERELLKIRAGGVEIVATYVFWNHHEEEEGIFDWSGRRDLRAFLGLCQQHGLLVSLRMGPFAHGESRNGGLPDWLYGRPFEARSNDPRYLEYARRLYGEIGRQAAGYMFKEGGPVVALQFENEFMDSVAPWETTQLPGLEVTPKGSGGIEHLRKLRDFAADVGVTAPLLTATGWGNSPIAETEFLPVFGGYAFYGWIEAGPQQPTEHYVFKDVINARYKFDRRRVPYACCEMGAGMQAFYKMRPVVPPESVEAMQVVYLGNGTNLIGYYVYHGGSNPVGKHSFLNEHRCPRISYDFQAPIGEFGQLAESYHRLRRQFLFLQEWGSLLAPMRTVLPTGQAPVSPVDPGPVRCAMRVGSTSGFVFLNNYQDHFDLPTQGPFTIQTESSHEQMSWPAGPGIRLETGVAAIFPYRLDLGGLELAYATAQPLARISAPDETRYFFFSPRGTHAEFGFPRGVAARIDPGQTQEWESGDLRIVSLPPDRHRSLRIENAEGARAAITLLSDEDSLRFWKGSLWGMERVVICDADLLFREGGLEVISHGQASASLSIYPVPDDPVLGPLGQAAAAQEGPFRRYTLDLPRAESACHVERLGADRALVRVGPDSLEGVDELLLRIECDGDVATAHLNGKLIHDHFCNGTCWELGLRQFLPPGQTAEIVLQVSPRTVAGGGPKIVAGAMANMELVTTGQAVASIGSINVTVRQRFAIRRGNTTTTS